MVGTDRVDDAGVLAELAHQFHPYLGMVLVAVRLDALADVVQEGAALGNLAVHADLGGEHSSDDGHLLGVREHVLAITRAVVEASEGLDELRRHVVHADVEDDLLALFVYLLSDLPCDLLDDFLDARRMDAAVRDQSLERHAGDLAAHGVEAGDDDRLGGVVDYHVDAGEGFERTNVAALAADDPPLHLVRGQAD